MSTQETVWQLRDRPSGPPYWQKTVVTVTPEPVNEAAYTAFLAHFDECPVCRHGEDGSSCREGAALWRQTQTGETR